MNPRCTLSYLLSLYLMTFPSLTMAGSLNLEPPKACDYLSGSGLPTRGYKNPDGIGYHCSSPYKELGPGSPKNNIAYYAEGDSKQVKKLKLVLNVNNRQTAKQAHSELATSAENLAKKALNAPLPDEVKKAILDGRNGTWKVGKSSLQLTRIDWPTGKGYDLKFVIE